MENNINVNAYNRLTGENLYKPYINSDCYINQKYYVKKVYYGSYLKTIVLPLECINSFGKGNPTGIKNTGKNETKLLNSRIRSQRNCIQKAIHNFSNCKDIGFTTLTYAENMQDVKQANHQFNLFIKRLKHHFSKYKKNTYINLKYLVAYEYQNRGAVHFHILFSRFISSEIIKKYWPFGFEYTEKVKKGTNEYVCKYVAKYITKALSEEKGKNIYDLNTKAYRFSANCIDPVIKVGVIEMTKEELKMALCGVKHFYMFADKHKKHMMGISIDDYAENDYFWQMEEYVPFYRKQYQQWKEQKLFFENYKKRHKKSISLNNNLLIQ